jgi:hypothetical protein
LYEYVSLLEVLMPENWAEESVFSGKNGRDNVEEFSKKINVSGRRILSD